MLAQTERRVLNGEAVPTCDKILSLFEPHTQIIVRHKAGKPVEFGRKVWLEEVEGDLSNNHEALREALSNLTINPGYGDVSLDENRHGIIDTYIAQLVEDVQGGAHHAPRPAVRRAGRRVPCAGRPDPSPPARPALRA